ncbi:MAG: ATP-binding cassette domain-containing protein [Rhodothermia bacterium]|nr:ATP-binding cassette domain-containing protein [Rhodothermia bacterium]
MESLAPQTPIIRISDLHLTRSRNALLREVNWCVMPGDHWVILGPNGAGKTTLLHALAGYMPPTSGKVEVLGNTFGRTDWRELRKHIGLVSAGLLPRIGDGETGLEVVVSGKYAQLNMWTIPTPEDVATAQYLMSQTETQTLEARPWRYLSQGERQRILIARARMANPALLILDEPCAGLDPVARFRFLTFVEKLLHQPDAPSVVLVTHHAEEITPSFSHVLMLGIGHTVASGPIDEVLTNHNLTKTFGVAIDLWKDTAGYHLRIIP